MFFPHSKQDVIPSEAGVPGNGRFCRCWGGEAKDLPFEDRASSESRFSLLSGTLLRKWC
jgi:hypothetical protein